MVAEGKKKLVQQKHRHHCKTTKATSKSKNKPRQSKPRNHVKATNATKTNKPKNESLQKKKKKQVVVAAAEDVYDFGSDVESA